MQFSLKNDEVVLPKSQSHVFRMIGNRESVSSACKRTLSCAGFSQFTSYGNNFVCIRQLESSAGRLMLYVQIELLDVDLFEISFKKVETSMSTVHAQMLSNKLHRIQSALELQAA